MVVHVHLPTFRERLRERAVHSSDNKACSRESCSLRPLKNQKSHFGNDQNFQNRNQNSHLKNRKTDKGITEENLGNQSMNREIKRYNFENQNNTQKIK